MKRNLVFVLFALVSVVGFSQVSWNAKVGMNISNYTGDFDMNAKVGFKIGGGMEYGFNEIWSLQPSLFVSSKGVKKDELSVNAVYLELPVMAAARFKVADNTNIVLSAGLLNVLILGEKKLGVGDPAVALPARNQPAAVRLLWIFGVVDDVADGLSHRAAFAGVERHQARGCHGCSPP